MSRLGAGIGAGLGAAAGYVASIYAVPEVRKRGFRRDNVVFATGTLLGAALGAVIGVGTADCTTVRTCKGDLGEGNPSDPRFP